MVDENNNIFKGNTMKMIEDWKQAYKWASTRCMALAATVQATWISIPEDTRAQVPAYLVSGLTVGLLVMGVIGRITQKSDNVSPAE